MRRNYNFINFMISLAINGLILPKIFQEGQITVSRTTFSQNLGRVLENSTMLFDNISKNSSKKYDYWSSTKLLRPLIKNLRHFPVSPTTSSIYLIVSVALILGLKNMLLDYSRDEENPFEKNLELLKELI